MGRSKQTEADDRTYDDDHVWESAHDARPILPKAAFFLGDLRDGLPMLNMQAAFLISAKNYTEKQIGILFLVFGLSQFICMTPMGYFLDYSNHKINWVITSALLSSFLTIFIALAAEENGKGFLLQVVLHIAQGAFTAIIPPAFNGVTLGVVRSLGFTQQTSRNRMMNHIGTAFVVAFASLLAYFLYPNIGALFCVSPMAALGVAYHLQRIAPDHVNSDAARALVMETPSFFSDLTDEAETAKQTATAQLKICWDSYYRSMFVHGPSPPPSETAVHSSYRPPDTALIKGNPPSVELGAAAATAVHIQSDERTHTIHILDRQDSEKSWKSFPSRSSIQTDSIERMETSHHTLHARSPAEVLRDPILITFTVVVFFFHFANSSVLPLVMQSLAMRNAQTGMLLSGLCIFIGQSCMAFFAKVCGDYSAIWGRKGLTIVGLSSLCLRCFLLTMLVSAELKAETAKQSHLLKALIMSTQFLDSAGAGIIGTLQILITSDISGGTGRFSLLLAVTTSSMCLGATISGYLGQALAQDYGYAYAFNALGLVSLIPLMIFVAFMPETLPDYARPKLGQLDLHDLLQQLDESRRSMLSFRRDSESALDDSQKHMEIV